MVEPTVAACGAPLAWLDASHWPDFAVLCLVGLLVGLPWFLFTHFAQKTVRMTLEIVRRCSSGPGTTSWTSWGTDTQGG